VGLDFFSTTVWLSTVVYLQSKVNYVWTYLRITITTPFMSVYVWCQLVEKLCASCSFALQHKYCHHILVDVPLTFLLDCQVVMLSDRMYNA